MAVGDFAHESAERHRRGQTGEEQEESGRHALEVEPVFEIRPVVRCLADEGKENEEGYICT